MKKMKFFLAAAALTLVTAGVFAGKSKFFSYSIYGTPDGGTTWKAFQDGAITIGASDETVVASMSATDIATADYLGKSYQLYYYNTSSNVAAGVLQLK